MDGAVAVGAVFPPDSVMGAADEGVGDESVGVDMVCYFIVWIL